MDQLLELIPNQQAAARPLFSTEGEYDQFRESFMETVIPQQEQWLELRRKSEEEARQRLLR